MTNDKIALAVFAASKFFKNEAWYTKNVTDYRNRLYSFSGLNLYDFSRKGFAAIFPYSNNEFKIFDFLTGNYLNVKKIENKELEIWAEKEIIPQVFYI